MGLPCEDHLRVRRVDCANNNEVLVPVTLRYSFCNVESTEQNARNKVLIKYKNNEIAIQNQAVLPPLTCESFNLENDVDLCTAGASASIKYTPETTLGHYCYSFSFYQVRKRWLPSGKCNTEVSLIMLI